MKFDRSNLLILLRYADDVAAFQTTWNDFCEKVEPISSAVPYMVF